MKVKVSRWVIFPTKYIGRVMARMGSGGRNVGHVGALVANRKKAIE